MTSIILDQIPFGNASADNRKTIGFAEVIRLKGDGTVPYEIAINAADLNADRHRQYPIEKHQNLLNSREFKLRVDTMYRAVQSQINEELLTNPENRERLKKAFLEAGSNLYASLPDVATSTVGETQTLSAAQVRARFPNVIAFNRSLMDARGISVEDLGPAMEQAGARSILLALQEVNQVPSIEGYPNRPIRVVVGYPPGGGIDMAARVLGQRLSENWRQPVVVENVPGAGGAIGAIRVATAAADGYTLMLSNSVALTINPLFYRTPELNALRALVPVTRIASIPAILAVSSSVPVGTVGELVALSKAKPNTLTYVTAGSGSQQHLAGELLKLSTGAEIKHIPYRSASPALNDVISGQATMIFENASIILPRVADGKVRPIAITSAKRSPLAPDIPTFEEAGVPGYEASSWLGIFAPAGTSKDIVKKLGQEIAKVLAEPDVRTKFAQIGMEVVDDTPEEFAAAIRTDLTKWGNVARNAGIKLQ